MHIYELLVWSLILFFQNISFTYVSRARTSGSILRHLKASIFSNGIWIFSNMLMLGPMFDYLTGKHGVVAQVIVGLVYTVATVSGSLFAHYWALRTEKGSSAVGANKRYAQVPVAEWERVKEVIDGFARVQKLAEDAYTLSVGSTPDSGVSARKIAGEIVTTGV